MRGASRDALTRSLEAYERGIPSGGSDTTGGADALAVSDGLYAVAALLDRTPSLSRALTDPASSEQNRRDLVDRLLDGQLAPLPLTVLRDLVGERWSSSADLRQAVEVLAADTAMRAAEGAGVLDEVEDELFRFARLLDREPALRSALTDPGLPAERKTALLDDLLASAQPITLQLLRVAVTERRGGSLESALEQLSTLAAKRRERYVAQVRVAAPLDADQEGRLSASLARIYGRQVELQVDVDPTVLGGVEVRVGDEVLNGTVERSLDTVRRQLGS